VQSSPSPTSFKGALRSTRDKNKCLQYEMLKLLAAKDQRRSLSLMRLRQVSDLLLYSYIVVVCMQYMYSYASAGDL
jgi:hypothetical protein